MEWRPRTRRALADPPLAPPSVPCSPSSREDSGPEQRGGGTHSARAASQPRCFRNRPRASITCARPSLRSRSWSRVPALRPSSPPRLPSPAAAPTYAAQPLGEVAPAGALGSPVQPARPVQNRLLQGQGAPHSPDARGGHGQEAGATGDDDSRGPAALLFHNPLGTLARLPRLQALGARRTRRTGPGAPPSTGQEAAPHAGKREDPACGVPGLGSDHPTTYLTGCPSRAPAPGDPRSAPGRNRGSRTGATLENASLALGKGKSWRGEPLYLEPKGVGEHKEGELPRTDH